MTIRGDDLGSAEACNLMFSLEIVRKAQFQTDAKKTKF